MNQFTPQTNLFTLHAFILYVQLILLLIVADLSRRLLAEPPGSGPARALLIFILVITCFALFIWILCFSLLLLPDRGDWLIGFYARCIYLVNTFLFLCAALAMCLTPKRLGT
jgi:hypothetical protein